MRTCYYSSHFHKYWLTNYFKFNLVLNLSSLRRSIIRLMNRSSIKIHQRRIFCIKILQLVYFLRKRKFYCWISRKAAAATLHSFCIPFAVVSSYRVGANKMLEICSLHGILHSPHSLGILPSICLLIFLFSSC